MSGQRLWNEERQGVMYYVTIEPDLDADASYLDQPEFAARKLEFANNEFNFVGVVVTAFVEGVEVGETSVWSVEDDDWKHVDEQADELIDELERELAGNTEKWERISLTIGAMTAPDDE